MRRPFLALLLLALIAQYPRTAAASCNVVVFGWTEGHHRPQAESILTSARTLGCKVLDLTGMSGLLTSEFLRFVRALTPADELSLVQVGHNFDFARRGRRDRLGFGEKKIAYGDFLDHLPPGVPTEFHSSICEPPVGNALAETLLLHPERAANLCTLTAVSQDDYHYSRPGAATRNVLPAAWAKRTTLGGGSLKQLQQQGLQELFQQWTFFNLGDDMADGLALSSEAFADYVLEHYADLCGPGHRKGVVPIPDRNDPHFSWYMTVNPFFADTNMNTIVEGIRTGTHARAEESENIAAGLVHRRRAGGSGFLSADAERRIAGRLNQLGREFRENSARLQLGDFQRVYASFFRKYPEYAAPPVADAARLTANRMIQSVLCALGDGRETCWEEAENLSRLAGLPSIIRLPKDQWSKRLRQNFLLRNKINASLIRTLAKKPLSAAELPLDGEDDFDQQRAQKFLDHLHTLPHDQGFFPVMIREGRLMREYFDVLRDVQLSLGLEKGFCEEGTRQKLLRIHRDLRTCENRVPREFFTLLPDFQRKRPSVRPPLRGPACVRPENS